MFPLVWHTPIWCVFIFYFLFNILMNNTILHNDIRYNFIYLIYFFFLINFVFHLKIALYIFLFNMLNAIFVIYYIFCHFSHSVNFISFFYFSFNIIVIKKTENSLLFSIHIRTRILQVNTNLFFFFILKVSLFSLFFHYLV